jgi:hypothetical protein
VHLGRPVKLALSWSLVLLGPAVIRVSVLERRRLHRSGGDIDDGWANCLDKISKTVSRPDDLGVSGLWNGSDSGASVEYRTNRCGADNGRNSNSRAKTP